MFTKKQQTPLEKSIQKVLDIKNDCFSRIKHLRIILDNYDQKEAKQFFSNNNTQIYYIFFYTFTNLEAALRQKGQKQSKAEYESLLFIFEKILTLLPELIERKWQYRSITMVMKKLLNPGNSFKIRQEGIRLFLIWYQVLGETGDSCIENMFKSLVPGLIPNVPNIYARNSSPQPRIGDHDPLAEYYDISQSAELANAGETGSNAKATFLTCDNEPLVIAHPSEPKDLTCYFLQCFMDYIVSQISKVCWHDSKEARSRTCFRYLFEKFKSYYLSFIFPSFDPNFSIYSQTLGLPEYRGSDFQHASELILSCECVVIRWLAKYMRNENVDTAINRRDSYDELPHSQNSATQSSPMPQPVQSVNSSPDYRNEWRDPTPFDYALVRSILYATRSNVNLIHELFRQAFLMPFTQAVTMRKVVSVYKDWIFSDRVFPPFMKEPEERNPPDSIKAGLSAFLRVFIVNGANIFLFHVPPEKPTLLDEQVDMCKRVLNIYRFMVMKLDMNKATWELLLLVMLRVTSLLFPEKVPSRKEDVLGGRLAPAFFQTLIVTWIRANVNVHISATLWEQFQGTLISLIHWEELIREWSKTMETITRVMSRYVYGIHLSDLPLERQVDKRKRSQKNTTPASRTETKKQSSSEFQAKNITSSAKPSQQYSPNGPLVNDHLSPHLPSIDAMNNSSKPTLTRSASDSNLTSASKRKLSRKKTFGISHSSLSAKTTANLKPLIKRARSTENFSSNLNESPSSSLSSVGPMRSPSPTPGSGLETSSLKDSPWQIEGNSLGSNNSSLTTAQRSVTAGGSYKGWSPEGSVILWRRMLGILGNVHRLDDPHLHYHVMLCLAKIVEDFIKIRDNMGISIDNNPTPPPPTHIPPLTFFSPWLFETFQMSNQFKKSKVLAYKLICTIALRSKEIPLGTDFLALFYLSIHQALHTQDLEIICKIVENCGVDLFASGLKGASILILDFIYACDKIVNAKHTKDMKIPQSEALSLLGTLLSLVETCKKMKALDPMCFEPSFVDCSNAKQLILKVLLSASKQEQTDLARCVVLNCLGIIMFQEIKNRSTSMSDFYPEIINIFIAETRFNNEYLPRIACDMLKLLADHAQIFLEAYPSIPKQIITGLVGSISNHLTLAWENSSFKDYKNLLLNLLFCLGEWVMSLPKKVLLSHPKESSSEHSLLAVILSVLNRIIFYSKSDSQRNKSHKSSDSFIMNESNEGLSSEKEVKHDGNPNLPKASSIDQTKSSPYFPDESVDDGSSVIKLAAKMLFGHLLYFMDHFPFSSLGPSRISSLINELDDNPFCSKGENHKVDELTSEIFNTPNVLLCMVNKQTIICFVDLSTDNATNCRQMGTNQGKSDPHIRIIARDLIGKFTWDCCPAVSSQSKDPSSSLDNYSLHGDDFSGKSHHELDEKEEEEEDPRSRVDPLDLLLREIGKCIFTSKKYFPNTPVPALNDNLDQAEENMMALLSNQHYQEMNFIERPLTKQSVRKDSAPLPSLDLSRSRFASSQEYLYFMYCRQLIDQLGFFFWEKRPKIELLCKNDKILRELRNLDLQKCRETHKIAVFYVADGQEDKNSILLNKTGSEGFERFVAGLGWEIDLETHTGFLGGLQQNKSTGTSAPYFANSFHEVIFHVSTRIPASMDDSDSLRRKLTHLGNDEVHIVWSEHSRDYRRGIIPTEFCDVLIAIYPLQSFPGYHRICVSRKPEVPFFGPLYSGAVIHHSILPDLVRATAINASRAGRIQRSMYQHHFEERARCIETIFKNHKDEKSFEDFSSIAFCPSQNPVGTSTAFVRSISSPGTVDQENKIVNPGDPNLASRPKQNRPVSASNLEHKLPHRMLPS